VEEEPQSPHSQKDGSEDRLKLLPEASQVLSGDAARFS
jgi:hypothetical protein